MVAVAPNDSPPTRPQSWTLKLGVALISLQSVALLGLAIAVATTASPVSAGLPVIGFAALFALLLAAIAVALWRRRRWASGAATAWCLLAVLVGFSQFGVNPLAACALILIGGAGVAALVAPATREDLTQDVHPD